MQLVAEKFSLSVIWLLYSCTCAVWSQPDNAGEKQHYSEPSRGPCGLWSGSYDDVYLDYMILFLLTALLYFLFICACYVYEYTETRLDSHVMLLFADTDFR